MQIGDTILIKPNPDRNIWVESRIVRIGIETECEYDIFGQIRKFSFYTAGYHEDKQVMIRNFYQRDDKKIYIGD